MIKFKVFNLYFCLFLFLLFWQWNGMIFDLWTGFDMGVQNVELLVSYDDALFYGKDLLVTPYPPLSWLYKGVVPVLTGGYKIALLQSLIINVLSAILRVAIIGCFWKNVKSKTEEMTALCASVAVVLLFPVSRGSSLLDLLVLMSSVLICKVNLYFHNNKLGTNEDFKLCYLYIILIGILIAIPQLAKFSYIAFALAFIIILFLIFVVNKKIWLIIPCVGSYVITTILLWVLSGESLQYLLPYIKAMLHFVGGYSEVMSLPFSAYEHGFRDFIFAIFVCCVYTLSLVVFFIKDKVKAISWFVGAPFLFLIFKEAFVRSDAHTISFANSLPFIICYLLFVLINAHVGSDTYERNFIKYNMFFWGILLSLFVVAGLPARSWYPTSTLYNDIEKMGSREMYVSTVEKNKEAARNQAEYINLYEDISSYPEKTLGMLSGEQTFFIAYDLFDRFKVNPIVSLWENFTTESGYVAAEQYYTEESPELLLYRPEPLDNGYFIFRMGTILQALLENYSVNNVDEYGYLVMLRNEQIKKESYSVGEAQIVKPGDMIEIPQVDDAYVFMKVDWDLTLWGKIAKFILKPSQTNIEIMTENGIVQNYRFFRTLSENGIYVSSLVNNSQDLANLFSGDTNNQLIQWVKINGDKAHYDNDIKISFYAVPFTEKQLEQRKNQIKINFNFRSNVISGQYQLFYAKDRLFSEERSKWLVIGEEKNSFNAYIPSDEWNTMRLDFPPQNAEYDLESILCDGKIAIIDGVNDLELTETENGYHITTGNYDPFIFFHFE